MAVSQKLGKCCCIRINITIPEPYFGAGKVKLILLMNNYIKLILATLLVVATSLFLTQHAMGQQIDMDLVEINRKSDEILRVRVESMNPRWVTGNEGRNIITTTHFTIIECIKGDQGLNDRYSMDMPGGTIGDTTQWVSSSVLFTPGEESILFLQKDPNRIIGGYLGKYPVIHDQVMIGNQKIRSSLFVGILKKSKEDPAVLSSFITENRVAAALESDGRLKNTNEAKDTLPPSPSTPGMSISSISPDRISAGTNSQVTICGTGFGTTQGTGKVEFYYREGQDKISANIISWSNDQIICTVPVGTVNSYPASAGSGPVTVTSNSGETSNGYPFRVTFGAGGAKWPGNSMTYRVNENLASITGEGQAIQNAAGSWNSANANFRFEYGGTHSNTASGRNDSNDLMWGTTANSSVLGQASIWYSGSTIVECDIVFNQDFTWNASPTVPSGSIDIETIALHELGHWLCLRDLYGAFGDGEYDQAKVMYGIAYYGQNKRNLHYDETAGIQWIYGQAETVSISGAVRTAGGSAVSGVEMTGLPGNPVTNTLGYYSAEVATGWTGIVTPVKTGYTFSLSSHTYTDQCTSLTGQDFTAIAESNNDATLSDLKVSGITVSGFVKTQLSYSVELPAGTTAVPVVTATTNDPAATKVITAAASLPGATRIRVTAQDGSTEKTYTINFTVASSSDATLSDLRVSGKTVTGFRKDMLDYTVAVPFETTAVPAVTAVTTHPDATRVISPAASLPGITVIRVTAEDQTTMVTYTVNFILAEPSHDASLTELKVNNIIVNGFHPATLDYDVQLAYGTTDAPPVTAIPSHTAAELVITQATSLPGTTVAEVTAEDGTTKNTYSVNFSIAKNSDATLSDLTVSGITVAGFSKNTLSYRVSLPYGTTAVPPVTATASDNNAISQITPAGSLPGTTTVEVTAADGATTLSYSVEFTLQAASSVATLCDLKITGTTVEGFDPDVVDYAMELPAGTSEVPEIRAAATCPGASFEIYEAASLPGISSVAVTAQDGVTTRVYAVSFSLAMDTDATLTDLMADGVTVPGFNPSGTQFTVLLPYGTSRIPVISVVTSSQLATRSIAQATSLPGTATVRVFAEDVNYNRTYLVSFTLAPPSNDATLSSLEIDGIPIGGFAPSLLSYQVNLPAGTTRTPEINAVTSHEGATATILRNSSLPGISTIRVTAQDGTTRKDYTVQFNVAKNSDATLANLLINGSEVPDFDGSKLTYEIVLPSGTNTPPAITPIPSDERASVEIILPDQFPGVSTIRVVAEDGVTCNSYEVLLRYPLSGTGELSWQLDLKVYPNPNNGIFTLECEGLKINQISLSVFDLTGRVVYEKLYHPASSRLSETIQLPGLPKGSYFIRVTEGSTVSRKKIIVE
jgi:hypothetical protein